MTLPPAKPPVGHHAPRRYRPLPPRSHFYHRMALSVLLGAGMVCTALLLGVCGYHYSADLPWLDSLVYASMILSGMGPVDAIRNDAGKWFESFYALFSGVVFITSVGVILAPVVHRFLHRFHLDIAPGDDEHESPSTGSTGARDA